MTTSAVRYLEFFPIQLVLQYSAFFILSCLIADNYQDYQIDYLHVCIVNTAFCAYLAGIAALEREFYCTMFAILQIVAMANNLMIMMSYVYLTVNAYSVVSDIYMQLNSSLIVLDLIALMLVMFGYRNPNT